jgi:hypothetical protein
MCKVSEQIERKKKDVEPPSRKPIVNPNTKGKGIILEEK